MFVRVFRVTPDEWDGFPNYIWDTERFLDDDGRIEAPEAWELALDETLEIEGDPNALTETLVDLREVLLGGPGQLVVVVEPTEQYSRDDELYWMNRPLVTWVQSTIIGIDAVADDQSVVVRTTDLRDGSPVGGLDVAISDSDVVITTDADGVGTGDLPTSGDFEGFGRILVAQAGDDVAILPSLFGGNGWQGSERSDQTRWYVLDDRGVYRPGETVRLKGWVRRLTTSGDGRLELLDVADQTPRVEWTAYDAQGNEIDRGRGRLSTHSAASTPPSSSRWPPTSAPPTSSCNSAGSPTWRDQGMGPPVPRRRVPPSRVRGDRPPGDPRPVPAYGARHRRRRRHLLRRWRPARRRGAVAGHHQQGHLRTARLGRLRLRRVAALVVRGRRLRPWRWRLRDEDCCFPGPGARLGRAVHRAHRRLGQPLPPDRLRRPRRRRTHHRLGPGHGVRRQPSGVRVDHRPVGPRCRPLRRAAQRPGVRPCRRPADHRGHRHRHRRRRRRAAPTSSHRGRAPRMGLHRRRVERTARRRRDLHARAPAPPPTDPVTCEFATPVGGQYRITAVVTDADGPHQPLRAHPLGRRRRCRPHPQRRARSR